MTSERNYGSEPRIFIERRQQESRSILQAKHEWMEPRKMKIRPANGLTNPPDKTLIVTISQT